MIPYIGSTSRQSKGSLSKNLQKEIKKKKALKR